MIDLDVPIKSHSVSYILGCPSMKHSDSLVNCSNSKKEKKSAVDGDPQGVYTSCSYPGTIERLV